MDIKEKLDKITSSKVSDWIEKSESDIKNEDWLDKSAKIALKILRKIRVDNISQRELAEGLNVSPQQISKILKGKENLTLETISKLERVLDIKLIEIQTSQPIEVKQHVELCFHESKK